MDKDIDVRDVSSSCRRLDFGQEDNESDLLPNENTNEEKRDEFSNLEDEEKTTDNYKLISEAKIPKIGMEFESEEEAYQFYNEYAYGIGFSIRRTTVHKDNKGKIIDRTFCCSCAGQRGQDKRDVNVKSHRPETRTDCLARLRISARYTRKYTVVEFVADHNGHIPVSPDKSYFLRSHRKITSRQAVQIIDISKSGIPPKAGLDYMAQQAGGRENVGFLLGDLRNYLHSKRTMQMKEGDAGGVLNYLQLKQLDDPNFFHAVQLDIDDLITNIFWADGRMMADYVYFGDVVCFDTTYKKHKDGRPIALFVGVNHHKHTTVFGAALLYDETAETFMWLFDTFSKAMNGKKPTTILTDQDAAMAKALEEKWPETCHRLCIWHIYQNAAIHLSNVFTSHPTFLKEFSSCIYDYEEEEDFIDAWQQMLDKYGLQNNDWLKRMYKKKEKWALVYGRQSFCADMITTQRSESMNSALKKYVNCNHNLLDFFHHFGRLVDDRRAKETEADLKTNHSIPVLILSVEILIHARTVYTHEVLKLFQEEFSKGIDSKVEIISEMGVISRYKITPPKRRFAHTVTFDALEKKVACSCKKFEFAGILCSHALKIFILRNIGQIPELYIMKRWTKRAKKGILASSQTYKSSNVTHGNSKEENEKVRIGERYKDLCRIQNQISTRASLTEEAYDNTRNILCKVVEGLDIGQEQEVIRPTLNPQYGMRKDFVSRPTEKQTQESRVLDDQAFEISRNLENPVEVEENVQKEIMIQGLKKKQDSKKRSGKRLKSRLEQKTSRKPKHNKNQPSNMSSTLNRSQNDGQNFNISSYNPNTTAILQMGSCSALPLLPQLPQNFNISSYNPSTTVIHQMGSCSSLPSLPQLPQNFNISSYDPSMTAIHQMGSRSLLPSLPQLPQMTRNNQVGLIGWNSTHPHPNMHHFNTKHAVSNFPPSQLTQLTLPRVHQPTCIPHGEGQQNFMSMTNLLQTQVPQQLEFGSFRLNKSGLEPQYNVRNEDETAPRE